MKTFDEPFIRVYCKDRDEWLFEREKGLGGSDAATVIGENPWKSNQELYNEKIGRTQSPDISSKPAVKYGNDAEEPLRQLFALDFPQYKLFHEENMLLRNSQLPFLQYSPDGELEDADGRRGLLEVKTTTINHSRQGESWAGQIPQNYYCQILHGLLVTGYSFVILKAQLKYDYGTNGLKLVTRHYHFERNEEKVKDDMKYLLRNEIAFWQKVEKREEPALILPKI